MFYVVFFHDVNYVVRTKLLKAYCNSFDDCELWMLDISVLADFVIVWRKGCVAL
jgi:hypothetical protein